MSKNELYATVAVLLVTLLVVFIALVDCPHPTQ